MKRQTWVLWVNLLVWFVILGFPLGATAQTQYDLQTVTGPATYTVVKDDTVWSLSPDGWTKIEAANAFLANPTRKFTTASGGPGLLIYPGETLNIPAGVSITFRRPRASGNPATTVTTPPAPVIIAAATPSVSWEQMRNFGLLMFLLLLAAIALLGYLLYRMLRNLLWSNDANAAARFNSSQQRLREMEQRINNRIDAHDGWIYALWATLEERLLFLGVDLRTIRDEFGYNFRRLRRQLRTNAARPNVNIGAGAIPRVHVDPNGQTDFVEVHRSNGERLSMTVVHGTNLVPDRDGVSVNGRAVFLTQDAARSNRDRHAELRHEREERELFAGV